MPRVLRTNQDLFGIALSITGYINQNNNNVSASQAAEHFGIDKKQLRKLISTLFTLENLSTTDFYFDFDMDAFDKNDVLRLNRKALIAGPPRLSNQQVSALAMGLEYISGFPDFANDEDLNSLMRVFGATPRVAPMQTQNAEKHSVLRLAIVRKMEIECEYINTKGEKTRRTLEPLRIDIVNGVSYLRAFCPKNQAVRSFRLDRMKNPQQTGEGIASQVQQSDLVDEINFSEDKEKLVEVLVEMQAKDFFRNFSSPHLPIVEGEMLRGQIYTGDYLSLARHVIARGGKVKVVSPQQAVRAVSQAANSLSLLVPEDED